MDTSGTIVTLTESFMKTVTGALPRFSRNWSKPRMILWKMENKPMT